MSVCERSRICIELQNKIEISGNIQRTPGLLLFVNYRLLLTYKSHCEGLLIPRRLHNEEIVAAAAKYPAIRDPRLGSSDCRAKINLL